MDMETQKALQQLAEQINGVKGAMTTEFAVVKTELRNAQRSNIPTQFMAALAIVVSLISGWTAMENRDRVNALVIQTAKNTRDIENIWPVVWQVDGPLPQASPEEK